MYKEFLPILNSAVTAVRMISLKWRLDSFLIYISVPKTVLRVLFQCLHVKGILSPGS